MSPLPPQSKSPRRLRIARIALASAVVVFLSFIALLHVAAWWFSLHDKNLRPYPSHIIKDSSGHTVRYYELTQTNADWNIVFIHGTPATAAVFGEQFRHPFPRANLFALDRPGFGVSEPDKRRPGLEDQATAVDALLSRIEDKPIILVGHSYGGPVALETALKFTNDIKGIVLIGGSVDPAQEHIHTIQYIADWPVFSWLLPRMLRQCNRELITLRGDLIRLKPRIASLEVPVVMLHGGRDDHVPVENVDYMRAELAAAGKSNLFDALIFPDYNHFIPWEHPDAVAAAIQKVVEHGH